MPVVIIGAGSPRRTDDDSHGDGGGYGDVAHIGQGCASFDETKRRTFHDAHGKREREHAERHG